VSLLRLIGLVVAVLLAAFVLRGLSRRAPAGIDLLALLVALLLALVSVDPAVVNLPATLLRIGAHRRGRLIVLLVLSNLALWSYLIWSGERRRREREGVNRVLEALFERLEAPPPTTPLPEVAIVIPAYNEEDSIAEVLTDLPETVAGKGVGTVVVCDGCTDRTAERARAAGADVVLELPVNQGGGAAIRVGYNYAARAGAQVVVTMDADGQHRPEDLPRLVEPVLLGEADLVIGSRRLGSFEEVSRLRSVGLGFFNALLNLLLATHLTDCSSGYRAFSVMRLPRLTTTESQYHTAETIMQVHRLGLRIAEVPVTVRRRLAGESKKGHDFVYGYRFARVMLSKWIRG
jgi:hypothetical protein